MSVYKPTCPDCGGNTYEEMEFEGEGFVGQDHVRAPENHYLVVIRCGDCGKFMAIYFLSEDDVDDDKEQA